MPHGAGIAVIIVPQTAVCVPGGRTVVRSVVHTQFVCMENADDDDDFRQCKVQSVVRLPIIIH